MKIELRQELPTDYRETENLTREAFWNHYSPGCCEHYLLHVMRSAPSFVKELDTVAVLDGRLAGNVVCVRNVIQGDDGSSHEVLGLGPIAVLPEYQGRGIGNRLIAHTQKLARRMGFRAILLMGDPDYYSRNGFVPAESFGIRTGENMYAAALLACPLYEGALSGLAGRYLEDPVYEVSQEETDRFDQEFPKKEKRAGVAMQKRFLELSTQQKKAE